MSYLNETNPEIFFAIPRPGGIANIEVPEPDILLLEEKDSKGTVRSSKSMRSSRTRSKSKSIVDPRIFSSTPNTTSREHRIQQALWTVPWVLFDDDNEVSEDVTQLPNPLQDTIDMLAISITTIMLLAANHKEISTDHLRWTMSYLECVKDEYGCNPPNVTGILNHIKTIKRNLESFNDPDENEPREEEEVVKEPSVRETPVKEPSVKKITMKEPDEGSEAEGESQDEPPVETDSQQS
ncbi:hypothetical protein JTB14_015893 [Gonioctena quinquepunctata]|nr:hypothetical protein JTB14_015893 [Gonioctena quinquepunctata]